MLAFIVYTYATMPEYQHMPVMGPVHVAMKAEQARLDAIAVRDGWGCTIPWHGWIAFVAWPLMVVTGVVGAAWLAVTELWQCGRRLSDG